MKIEMIELNDDGTMAQSAVDEIADTLKTIAAFGPMMHETMPEYACLSISDAPESAPEVSLMYENETVEEDHVFVWPMDYSDVAKVARELASQFNASM